VATTYHCGCGWTKKRRSGTCPGCKQRIIPSDEVSREWKKYPKELTKMVDAGIARERRKKQAERAKKEAQRASEGVSVLSKLLRRDR